MFVLDIWQVLGDSIFNVLKIGQLETDADERPLKPPKILEITVTDNPFDDIVPRITTAERREQLIRQETAESANAQFRKRKKKSVENKNLLSFANDEDDESGESGSPAVGADGPPPPSKFKMRSLHDVVKNDPKLSQKTHHQVEEPPIKKPRSSPPPEAKKISSLQPSPEANRSNTIDEVAEPKLDTTTPDPDASINPGSVKKSSKKKAAALFINEFKKDKGSTGRRRPANYEDDLMAKLSAFRNRIRKVGQAEASSEAEPGESTDKSWLNHRLVFSQDKSDNNGSVSTGKDKLTDYVVLDPKRPTK
ncbi:Peptidyl-prolyl isomerase cwc27 [Dimargaris cristalligena]|nr:Peptidyl-prolyl isomerase cwc27 [Dimargaris cristalligena]